MYDMIELYGEYFSPQMIMDITRVYGVTEVDHKVEYVPTKVRQWGWFPDKMMEMPNQVKVIRTNTHVVFEDGSTLWVQDIPPNKVSKRISKLKNYIQDMWQEEIGKLHGVQDETN